MPLPLFRIFPKQHTQIIKFQVPKAIAKKVAGLGFRIQVSLPREINQLFLKRRYSDEAMICLCERVSVGQVQALIKKGITDLNLIKAITRAGMGPCGSKTCEVLIKGLLREEGIPDKEVVANTKRPLFIEIPLAKFPDGECKMKNIYDIIVIGAGSIGLPTAYNLAKAGMKVLVLEAEHSPGQGNNKKAIGGVRATHSDFGKINVCLRSIEILKNWQEETGEDIGWLSNGYSYPAYNEKDAQELQDLMKIQHSFGLNIKWLSPDEYSEIVPGILQEGLQGSTYSPEDGSCRPLLVSAAYFEHSQKAGVEFHFQCCYWL